MTVTQEQPAAVKSTRTSTAVSLAALAALAGASVVLGLAAAKLAAGGAPVLALLFPIALVPVVVWREPRVGLLILLAGAVTVEQFGYDVGPRAGAVTSQIPFFKGVLPAGVNPAEVLAFMSLIFVVMLAVRSRTRWLHDSAVLRLVLVVLAFVALYLVVGLGRGGDLRNALWEVRPFVYLACGFLLASALVRSFADVRPMLWIIVLGSGAKASYGLTIWWSVRSLQPRPEAILAHEESFFFGLYIVLTAAMWVFRFRDPLRIVATILLPLVLLGDMVNSRRTAWFIVIVGIAVLGIVALVRLREHRRSIVALWLAAIVGATVYLPAFWSGNGTLAQPARAVRSEFAPTERDLQSNQYREIETYNIMVYINQTRSTGLGFGRPIVYEGIVDLTKDAPILAYVPHNGVLYLWMRMGVAGLVAFALLIANAVISAARLTAAPRRDVAMIGAVATAAIFGYVAMGYVDMGFFWFRNAIAMGTLLGVVDALTRTTNASREDAAGDVSASDPRALEGRRDPGSRS